jgi:hypothetical protein
MADPRVFIDDEEPPFGERIEMVNEAGLRIVWTGKRWAEREYVHDIQMHEAWPPSNQNYEGPWVEVVSP